MIMEYIVSQVETMFTLKWLQEIIRFHYNNQTYR